MPHKDALISNDLRDSKEKSAKINEIDKNKNTQKLIREVIIGDIKNVKALLQEGVNINDTDEDGCTALISAVKHDRIEIVEILLAVEGIDVNILDNSGQSAFVHAISTAGSEFARIMNSIGEEAVKIEETKAARVKIIDLLLESKKVNINAFDGCGNSLLMSAVFDGDEDIFDKILNTEGLQINSANNGINALLIAVSDTNVNFVEKLIKYGADVNTVAKEYWDEYYEKYIKNQKKLYETIFLI